MLAWTHQVVSLQPVGEPQLVQETAQGLRKLLAKPRNAKITVEGVKSDGEVSWANTIPDGGQVAGSLLVAFCRFYVM